MSHSELLKRITVRPDVFGGKPIVRDMRLSVELILSLLAQGVTTEEILDDYPKLEADDVRACIAYAHAVEAGEQGPAVPASAPAELEEAGARPRLPAPVERAVGALPARQRGEAPARRHAAGRAAADRRRRSSPEAFDARGPALPAQLAPDQGTAYSSAMRPERAAASVAEKLRVTFDLVETGLALQRQNIRRRHPAASEAEIDRRLDEWLGDRPPDSPGRRIDWPRRRT